MSYLLLIQEPLGQREARTPEEGRQAYARMTDFADRLRDQGLLQAAQSLQSLNHGSRVRRREGRVSTLDGPFAEAKEMVGGFFLLNVASRDEALALAAECPAAAWATVEVRGTGPCYVSR